MTWLSDSVVAHLREVTDESVGDTTRYELLEEIGRGGMGVVYLAMDRTLERHVALKLLKAAETSADTAARLQQEAQILASLEHPGIVPVHDAGTLPDGRAYYAMKLVEGVRLDHYAASNPTLNDALRLFARICDPVAFAHSRGILHRDLKPENIMIGLYGEVLVLDWGIAVAMEPCSSAPTAGTRGFMAPEQASGAGGLDPRCDVYSLGRILEFLGQGRGSDKPLRGIIGKCVQSDRAQRYAGPLDLAADIHRFLDGQPVTAYRESVLERTGRWLSRNLALAAILAAYILARAIVLLFSPR